MFRYLDKIETFLVVYETKSFSKASKKLNVSQPAVTQKIQQLEKLVGLTLIERKKNGILLTKKGEEFLKLAFEIDDTMKQYIKKIENLKTKISPFIIGASSTIGNYILPTYIPYLKNLINMEINLVVKNNTLIIEHLLNNKINLAFTSIQIDNPILEFIPFKKDKIVFFSNKPLPSSMEFEDLLKFEFICREDDSVLKNEVSKILKKYNKDCSNFNITSYVGHSTALKFTLLNSPKQYISLTSYETIKHYIKTNQLFITQLKNINLERNLYIVRKKDDNSYNTQQIINYLKELL